jgi:hypothetical protein
VKGFCQDRHSAAEERVGAVPGEALLRRPVGGVCGEGDFPVFHTGEEVGGFAGLVSFSYEDGVVLGYRPEAVVEEPVGVFGEGDAVGEVVVTAPGELVDVGGVDDSAGGKGGVAVAGQRYCTL